MCGMAMEKSWLGDLVAELQVPITAVIVGASKINLICNNRLLEENDNRVRAISRVCERLATQQCGFGRQHNQRYPVDSS